MFGISSILLEATAESEKASEDDLTCERGRKGHTHTPTRGPLA